MMHFPFCRPFVTLIAAVWLALTLGAPASAAVVPLWYAATVDAATSTATFLIQFDRAPDLLTVDEYDRSADSFQFWVDSEAPDPIRRTYDALEGLLAPDTQTVISAREISTRGMLEFIWVKPLSWSGPRDRGGWGSVEAHVPFNLFPNNLLAFTVPWSTLREKDGTFYYALETFAYGAWGGETYQGVSGQLYFPASPVPEPSPALLLLAGIGILAAYKRARMTPALA